MAEKTPPFLKVTVPTPTFADLEPTESFGVIQSGAILSGSVITHTYPTLEEADAAIGRDIGKFCIVRQTLELVKIVTVNPVKEK